MRFIIIIIFMIITFWIVKNTLDSFTARAHSRAEIINNVIYSSLDDASQIMHGLSITLAQESIKSENKTISKLLNSFSYNNHYKSIPFSCFKVIDSNNLVIEITSVPDELFIPQQNTMDMALVEMSKQKPLELKVEPIRLSNKLKEVIIPICMSFNNKDGNHAGTLCSGLLVDKLNDKLKRDCFSENLVRIALVNNDKIYKNAKHYKIDDIFAIKNLLTLFEYAIKNKHLTVYLPLRNYPLLIAVEVKLNYLVKEIFLVFLLCMGYFILFILFGYCLSFIYKNFYMKPLYSMQKKLHKLPKNNIKLDILGLNNFSMQDLEKNLDDIIDQLNILERKSKQEMDNRPITALRNNVLDFILTGHYYDLPKKSIKMKFSSLYLSKLKQMLYKKTTTENLLKFLDNIAEYCGEYYGEINIEVIVQQKDCKDFNFYYTALVESIFHIFTLIIRAGGFDIDNQALILKGEFTNKNFFPTISIEAGISGSALKSIGWESGPACVYAGLLTVYLLAKENNLIFNIEQKGQKVIFILEPIDTEQLQKLDNILLPLIV